MIKDANRDYTKKNIGIWIGIYKSTERVFRKEIKNK